MTNDARADRGFTLVELLTSIMIIGILAAVAIPLLFSTVDTSRGAVVQSAVSNAKKGVIAAVVESGELPAGGHLTSILTAHDDPAIVISVTGTVDQFCVDGVHTNTGTRWASPFDQPMVADRECASSGALAGG